MTSFTVLPLQTTRDSYGGTAFGRYAILVEAGTERLIFVYAQSHYLNRMSGVRHGTASIYRVTNQGDGMRSTKFRWHECGRLSKATLNDPKLREEVVKQWGHDVADALHPRKTIRLTPKL